MCKFEDVQMCRLGRSYFAISVLLLISFCNVAVAQSSDDFWKERKAATARICLYLEEQKVDSILWSLPEQVRSDTSLRRKLEIASEQVQVFKSTTKKLVLREAGKSCAYWYMDGDNPRMLVLVSFDLSGNSCKIESINIFDQQSIQSKGLSPFPPPPPPPPPPKPR